MSQAPFLKQVGERSRKKMNEDQKRVKESFGELCIILLVWVYRACGEDGEG